MRRGFTLIELMMVVALVGVVAGLATMRFSDGVRRLEYNYLVRQITGFMARARSEAVMKNSVMIVTCRVGAGVFEREAQVVDRAARTSSRQTVDRLQVPVTVLKAIVTSEPQYTGTRQYVFLPDGLGNEQEPLELDLVEVSTQTTGTDGRYYPVRRDRRGQVRLGEVAWRRE